MNNKMYEKELPLNYKEVKHIDATEKKFGIIMNVVAFVVLVIVMAISWLVLKIRYDRISSTLIESFIVLLLLCIVLPLYIVLHELVHGLCYKLLTKEKLTFGLSWSCAFCGVPNLYTYKKTALISLLAPFITFTVILVPVTIALYFVSPVYFLAASFALGLHLGGCSGDLYVTYLLLVKYQTTGKTIALTRWTFVDKEMSLLFNMLSRLVITFLPRSKYLLISWL